MGGLVQHAAARVFMLAFRRKDGATGRRHLKLLASEAGIHVENHTPMLYQCVRDFLRSGEQVGEVKCF
jgi:hypothetical protein